MEVKEMFKVMFKVILYNVSGPKAAAWMWTFDTEM